MTGADSAAEYVVLSCTWTKTELTQSSEAGHEHGSMISWKSSSSTDIPRILVRGVVCPSSKEMAGQDQEIPRSREFCCMVAKRWPQAMANLDLCP
jgi:hypothetical protein